MCVRHPGSSPALRLAVALAATVAGGCAAPYRGVATDGRVYAIGRFDGNESSAAIASAAHDLGCPRAQIHVLGRGHYDTSLDSSLVLDGCGVRVTYLEVCDAGTCRYFMTALLRLGSEPAPTAPPRPAP